MAKPAKKAKKLATAKPLKGIRTLRADEVP